MRVAVTGAGLSGLACAVLLERGGLTPDVYESKHKIGARFANTEAIMPLLDFPVKDYYRYLLDRYGVAPKPLNPIRRVILHGPTRETEISGNLGYITARGNYPEALEVQLGDMSRAPVEVNSCYTLDDLKARYDVVVVATGNNREARRQGTWETDVTANLIGAAVRGTFDPYTAEVWLDDRFAPQGYGFLLPYNSGTASLVIAVPGTEGVNLEKLWEKFLASIPRRFEIRDTFQLYSFEMGRNSAIVRDNVLYTGTAGGFVMPFMGFGQFTSMISGFEAARAILKGNLKQYEREMRPLRRNYHMSLKMRRIIAAADNDWYDRIVRILERGPVKRAVGNASFPILKAMVAALDPLIRRRGELH